MITAHAVKMMYLLSCIYNKLCSFYWANVFIIEYICAYNHEGAKWPSDVPFKIRHFEEPFEVSSFEHFGLKGPLNMASMIVFTPKCPSEGKIFRFGRTPRFQFLAI